MPYITLFTDLVIRELDLWAKNVKKVKIRIIGNALTTTIENLLGSLSDHKSGVLTAIPGGVKTAGK